MNNRIYEEDFFAGNSSRIDSWKEHVLTFRMEYLGSNNSHRVVVTCHYIILPLDQSRHFGLSKSGSCSKNLASTEVRDSIPSILVIIHLTFLMVYISRLLVWFCRMIRRAPGLKLVVGALLRSLKPIGNTVLIAGIFFVVFGILGVQVGVFKAL
jgi:hypothetical protein